MSEPIELPRHDSARTRNDPLAETRPESPDRGQFPFGRLERAIRGGVAAARELVQRQSEGDPRTRGERGRGPRAERCLRAAVYAYGSALDHSVRDQIEGIAKRESADHWWGILEDADAPNALQCSSGLLDRWFRWAEEPVLWRPIVALANSSEEVRITFRSNEPRRDPAQLIIDTKRAILDVGGECTAVDHGGDSRRLFEAAEELRATMVDAVRRARSGNDA